MNATERTIYGILGQAFLLLLLYGAAAFFTAVKFLPADPLALGVPYKHVAAFSDVLLQLAVINGLLAGGVYAVTYNTSLQLTLVSPQKAALLWAYRALTTLNILAVLASFLGIFEGRYLLSLPPLLDVLLIITLILFFIAMLTEGGMEAFKLVWLTGLVSLTVGVALGILPAIDYQQDRVLRSLSLGLQVNIGYTLMALVLLFWLLAREADLQNMAVSALYTAATFMVISGALLTIAPLYTFGASTALSTIAFLFVPLSILVFIGRVFRVLLDDSYLKVTAPIRWCILVVGLYSIGWGILGALSLLPGVRQWTVGTWLDSLQYQLTVFAAVAAVLGMGAYISAKRTIKVIQTRGWFSFWMVALGLLGGALSLGGAGLVQTYSERILSIGYLDVQKLLVPLYIGWIIALLMLMVGVMWYVWRFRSEHSLESS